MYKKNLKQTPIIESPFIFLRLYIIICFLFAFNSYAQWTFTSCPASEAISMTTDGSNIYGATGFKGGFYTSSDLGQNWTAPISFPSGEYIVSIFYSNGYLYLGGSNGNYRSSDGGITWNQMLTLKDNARVYMKFESDLYVGTFGGGVYKSSDLGNTWTQYTSGMFNLYVSELAHDNESIYAANAGGLFKSDDMGVNWSDMTSSIGAPLLSSVVYDGKYVLIGSHYSGVYRSSDGGVTWFPANEGLMTHDIRSLYVVGNIIFLGCSSGSYYSLDHGATWIDYNSGFTSSYYIQSYIGVGSDLFCGTNTDGIWKRNISELLGIKNDLEISIHVYPNPSNGKFTFFQNKVKNVDIKIYTSVGRLIYKTNSQDRQIYIDLSEEAKGVYIVRITDDNNQVINKRLVIK